MAVISGKDGTIYLDGTEAAPCSNWTLTLSGNLKRYAANDTQGWPRRVSGVHDATGTFLIRADNECNCPVAEGESYVALLVMEGTTTHYAGRLMVADISVEDDIDDGEIVNYVVTWEADGPWTKYGMAAQGIACSSSSGS